MRKETYTIENQRSTDNKVTVSVTGEDMHPIDDDISHTVPFLLGFVVGIVIPVIFLVVSSRLAEERFCVKIPFRCEVIHCDPIVVLLFFVVTVCGLVAIYWIHHRQCITIKKLRQEQIKSDIEFRSGIIKDCLDVLRSDKERSDKRVATVNINMTVKDGLKDDLNKRGENHSAVYHSAGVDNGDNQLSGMLT